MSASLPLLAAANPEGMLFTVLVQLAVIIVAARVFAVIFRKLRQPVVVGEIAAGIILGPSLFGHFFPDLSAAIFQPAASEVFHVISHLGLILLLFLVGLEFDFSHLRWHGRTALAVSLAGIAAPFALGAALAPWIWANVEAPPAGDGHAAFVGFTLFMGTALAITAIPILGRMLMELNCTRTKIGAVTIASAAFDDAVGWILLATVSSIVRADFQVGLTLRLIGETVAFVVFMALVVRPLMKRFVRSGLERGHGDLQANHLTGLYAVLFLCALATSLIGIFAIFGAFLLGVTLSDEPRLREVMTRHLRNFLAVIFLPIFFTYTGLRTDIGTLATPTHWLLLGGVLAAAVAGKLGACALAARLGGFNTREALCTGVLMNTRALMALIVINVGRDLGVLPPSIFCMMVLMALATTVMTTPLLLWLMRGTELEPYILQSEFYRGPGAARAEDEAALAEAAAGR